MSLLCVGIRSMHAYQTIQAKSVTSLHSENDSALQAGLCEPTAWNVLLGFVFKLVLSIYVLLQVHAFILKQFLTFV